MLNILRGQIVWVGIPSLSKDELTHLQGQAQFIDLKYKYADVKPGLMSLYRLQKKTGISAEKMTDLLAQQLGFNGIEKLALILKFSLANALYENDQLDSPQGFDLFGIHINNLTMTMAVKRLLESKPSAETNVTFFANVNSFNLAHKNTQLKSVLNQADQVYADGSGVRLAAKKLGYRLKDNVNGTDLLPVLCEQLIATGKSVFLLGASEGVAQTTANKLKETYVGLTVSGTHHGFFDRNDSDSVIALINESKADVLLVALGSPHQELWLHHHKHKLGVNSAAAVGGLFDFYSGRIPRAPLWLREIGMEWVWRLIQEPKSKFNRYVIGNPIFMMRTFFYNSKDSHVSDQLTKATA
jgi:N-acetylglucosaminyldiphosphoundecaprenol N-acetyl-beta-D-mannosaminyltransferase